MNRRGVLLVVAAAVAIGLAAAGPVAAWKKRPPGHGHGHHCKHRHGEGQKKRCERGTGELRPRPIDALGPAKVRYVPGQLLVRFRPGTSAAAINAAAVRAGGKVVDRIPALGVHVIAVPPSRAQRALSSLRSEPSVASVERDVVIRALDTIPNDALWPSQWGLRLIGAPRAWDATRGSDGIVVAVLDTGLDLSHPDLSGAVLRGTDVVNSDADASDDEGHGTSVAGVIAARTNNREGQAGVCWACSLLPVKVMDSSGSGTSSTLAQGIVWATDHGARVINMSLGGPGTTSAVASAVAYAARRNVVLVAAAGNSGVSTPFYPAAYSDVISVAATNEADARYEWSNYGDWVKVAAPGCNVAPDRGGGYVAFCGTSSAAPIVAGIAGLALSLNPGAPASTIDEAIESNAVPVPGVARFGRLKAPDAMTAVSPSSLPPQPQPPPVATPPAPPPPAAVAAAPTNLTRPRLLGRARVGRNLRVTPGTWRPASTRIAYRWQRCRRNGARCVTIRGARGRSYRLRRRDRGRRLRAIVVAFGAGGTARVATGGSSVVR
jgi:subtilisin family serine protease